MSLLAFFFAALVLAITPGPGIAYVVARTVAGGRPEGLASCLGTALGGLVHVVGDKVPVHGSAGDVFMQAQLPLHSGRILGTPGRVAMSAMGVLVAVLSMTGVVIWVRKRRARRAAELAAQP